ncbi:hypothetical protein SO802_003328 [Lithocarpus litseifolius]|uniref:DUF8040 domain-containing protein n=1 Tax=Lithocarpus litseifolius TaxID=425828 RepID=A0AAW2E1S2_9ROSI
MEMVLSLPGVQVGDRLHMFSTFFFLNNLDGRNMFAANVQRKEVQLRWLERQFEMNPQWHVLLRKSACLQLRIIFVLVVRIHFFVSLLDLVVRFHFWDAEFEISDDIVLATYVAGCASVVAYMKTYMTKVPMHTNIQIGYEWVQYTLNGNEKKYHNAFRMSSHVFRQLCNTLRTQYGYDGTKSVCLEESVAITLVLLGNAMGNRMMQDRFQHSGETVHRHVATGCIGSIDGVHVPVVLLVEE